MSGVDVTLSETFPRTIRARRCDGCERIIPKGTRYRRWKGTASDVAPGILTYYECVACCDRYKRPIPAAALDDHGTPAEGQNQGGA